MHIPLWRQLQTTAAVVEGVCAGRSMTPVLAGVPGDLRAATQALSYEVMRAFGTADALLRQLAQRTPSPPVRALLLTAFALAWRDQAASYDPHTLVNQAVEAAKRQRSTLVSARFVNACLRRLFRERDALARLVASDPVATWNHPRWWVDRVRHDYPDHWRDILKSSGSHPPMTLRVNLLKTSVSGYLERLHVAGINGHPTGSVGVCLDRPRPVHEIPGFDEGWVSVQDEGAQRAAPLLLDGLPGDQPRILDACAAPGGKTAHLLECRPAARVTALEIDPQRCERIAQTLARLGLSAHVVQADAARPTTWWDGQSFDAILLDAPCTASGIVRRHPDVPWLRRERDIAQLAAVQAELLRALWPLVRRGGRLLYCTCSVFRAEGSAQIDTFLKHNSDASLLPSPGHLQPVSPANSESVPHNAVVDHDGFFYGLLQKQA